MPVTAGNGCSAADAAPAPHLNGRGRLGRVGQRGQGGPGPLAAAMATPAVQQAKEPEAELTGFERRFVLQTRLVKMLWEGAFGMGSASLNMKLLRLSGNDTAVIAAANAAHWSLTSIGKVMLTPLFGALSDTLGRRWLWALGRLAMCVQFAAWWG